MNKEEKKESIKVLKSEEKEFLKVARMRRISSFMHKIKGERSGYTSNNYQLSEFNCLIIFA